MTEKLRVLIVDDEPLALEYMARILGAVDDIETVSYTHLTLPTILLV